MKDLTIGTAALLMCSWITWRLLQAYVEESESMVILAVSAIIMAVISIVLLCIAFMSGGDK